MENINATVPTKTIHFDPVQNAVVEYKEIYPKIEFFDVSYVYRPADRCYEYVGFKINGKY